jgi:heme exporter protein CcmD
MNHDAFMIASYAASALVLGGLALWIALARRKVMRDFAALESAGIKRRSEN